MKEDPPHQLNIEGAQAKCTLGSLAAIGKCLRQEIVKRCPIRNTFAKFFCLFLQPLVRERLEIWFQRIDLFNERAGCFDLSVIWGAKNLSCKRSNTQHLFSALPAPVLFTILRRLLVGVVPKA